MTRAIRGWGGKFAPPIAALVEVIRDERHQAEAEEKRKAAQRQADRERSGAAPVWHGYLWVAALWHSISSRGQDVPVVPRLEPYREVCRRLDLRPEHGVRGHRDHHELKVKQALRLAEEIFIASGEEDTEEARRAAVELIIGRVRREDA